MRTGGWYSIRSAVLVMVALLVMAPSVTTAQTKNPIEAAKEALKKALEQKKKKAKDDSTQTGSPGGSQAPETAAKTTLSSNAKVEAQVLLTSEPGLQFVVSPKGHHLAAAVLRGSRSVVVHDGVDGPRFDEIINVDRANKVLFSLDGNHYAYVGRLGQEWVVTVDGKEQARGPWGQYWQSLQVDWADFTPGGKHFWFTAPGPNGGHRLYLDGRPGLASDAGITPVFSSDGEHHAYVILTGSSSARGGTYSLIVDGKPAPYVAGEPQFTGDGLHLFTKRQVPAAQAIEVLADGKPFMRGNSVRLYMAPVGAGVIGVVATRSQTGALNSFLTIGNQKVPGSDCQGGTVGIDKVWISPDGKHFAGRCRVTGQGEWMIVPGKKGQNYQFVASSGGATRVVWLPDGRVVYRATAPISGGRASEFLVVGEEEWGPYFSLPLVPARTLAETQVANYESLPAVIQGNRIAFIATMPPNGTNHVVVVDGKATPTQPNPENLEFSPDGSRVAYVARGRVVVDGQPGNWNVDAIPSAPGRGKFVWSPDGKHIAYSGGDAPQRGIILDGKFFPTGPGANYALTFTPDSKHLIWATLRSPSPRLVIMVDSEPVVEVDPPGGRGLASEAAEAYWAMGSDGVLAFIAQAEGAMKRFRVTPGTGTSIETLLGKATKPR